jgi:hypothetical protein
MGTERSGLKTNGIEIGAENDRYVDEDGTLIAAIRWRRSDDISTVIDGEAKAEAPFSRQRSAALLRSRSRGNAYSEVYVRNLVCAWTNPRASPPTALFAVTLCPCRYLPVPAVIALEQAALKFLILYGILESCLC